MNHVTDYGPSKCPRNSRDAEEFEGALMSNFVS